MIGYVILLLIAVFVAVIAVRTVRFTPKPQPAVSDETFDFEKEAAVDALAQLVRCKTVSYNDKALEDDGEFEKLIGLLPGLYPKVFEVMFLFNARLALLVVAILPLIVLLFSSSRPGLSASTARCAS